MATHSSVLAWRIPETRKPGGLPSMGLHRVGHNGSDLAAAAAAAFLILGTGDPVVSMGMHWGLCSLGAFCAPRDVTIMCVLLWMDNMLMCATKNTDLGMEVWIQSLPSILLQKIVRLEPINHLKLTVFKKNINFLFVAVLGLRCCAWAFSSCTEQGLAAVVVVCGLFIVVAFLVERGL